MKKINAFERLEKVSVVAASAVLAVCSIVLLTLHAQANTSAFTTLAKQNTPYSLEYTNNMRGGLVFTGNALTLSRSDISQNGVAGTFITTNTNAKDGDYPTGTTSNWQENSSSAQLVMPEGSTIEKAYLLWGGSYIDTNVDVSSSLSSPVALSSDNQNWSVNPQKTFITDQNQSPEGPKSRYTNVADVSSLLSQAASGSYTVSGVPAAISSTRDTDSGIAGWTLAVAYRNTDMPIRNISIFTGFQTVEENRPGDVAKIEGFSTPASGQLNGKLFVSALEGDATLSGDQMKFGSQSDNISPISGPNNIQDNFFAAQINNENGVDTTGTFGNFNQVIGQSPAGKRHGLDLATVDISDRLSHNQTAAYSQGTTWSDSYSINAVGTQIDVYAPDPTITITRDKDVISLGDTITYTVDVANNDTVNLQNGILNSLVPEGTEMVANSTTLDGTPINLTSVNAVNVGNFEHNQVKRLSYQVKAVSMPTSKEYRNKATMDYTYNFTQIANSVQDKIISDEVVTTINPIYPPVAHDDSAITNKNEFVTIDVLVNDTDKDNNIDPTTLRTKDNPQHGTAEVVNGTFKYTPERDYVGNDQFAYTICDRDNQCSNAQVSVVINDIAAAAQDPITISPQIKAIDDSAETKSPESAVIDVTKNDVVAEPITPQIVTEPSHGDVSVQQDNNIHYTPNQQFSGNDSFVYKICENNVCDSANVAITVKDENAAPAPTPAPSLPQQVQQQVTQTFSSLVRSGGPEQIVGVIITVLIAAIAFKYLQIKKE